LSDEDWWSRWFRKRRGPFFSAFGDLDNFFKEFEEMMEREFSDFSKKAPKELVRERTRPDGSKVREWGPFVYGYSMTVGPDGKPHVREFGNIKHGTALGKPRIDIKESREPLVDVLSTNGEVNVVAELPGVRKEDIKLRGTKERLMISVNTPQRKYYKEVDLPANVDTNSAKSTYKNGVLEVILKKRKEEKPKGETIEVE
jgi:HSP20 family protein